MATIHLLLLPARSCRRPRHRLVLRRVALAAGLSGLAAGAAAQVTPSTSAATAQASQTLPAVTVTGSAAADPTARSQIGGFGDKPLWQVPQQAQTFSAAQLRQIDAQRLSDITTLDASVSDSYNAAGYWDILSVRGYTLDNQNNYRREGLPISAETSIPLDNKEAVEVLKGASGMQAGVSAPGGMVNFLVKRPTGTVRDARVEFRDGSALAAVDLGQRFGAHDAFGLRFNAAVEHLDPQLQDSQGHRHLLALAADWHASPSTVFEAEVESSHRSQPSQPGFSLLGDRLPPASSIDPRTNLNNQPWSLPVVFDGTTGTLRWRQQLERGWKLTVTGGVQDLKSDDRLAYAYGCNKESNGLNVATYCSDGTFDYYNYRSDNEHRRTNALDVAVAGSRRTGAVRHDLALGVLAWRYTLHTEPMTDDTTPLPQSGNVDGLVMTSLPPSLQVFNTPNTALDNRSTEIYVHDAMRWPDRWTTWWGLRHSALDRASVMTDGSQATRYRQGFTTPWLGLSRELAPGHMVYMSWGEGVETYVAPIDVGGTAVANAGQPLPAARSFQSELGYKWQLEHFSGSLAYFHIDRPAAPTLDASSHYAIDGKERHQGLELETVWHEGAWSLSASGLLIDAKIHGSNDPTLDNQRPVNVPSHALKVHADYRVAGIRGLTLNGSVVHEGRREILLPNSLMLPSWTRVDVGVAQRLHTQAADLTLSAGLYNALDRRAWQESPTQYQHVYLYPLAPRTLYVSLQAGF